MKDIIIIANPSSGKKQAEEYAAKAQSLFEDNQRQADVRITESEEDIVKYVKEASSNKYDTMILLGGDGTVSKAGESLKDEEYRPKIGIIPTGTINNIARGLGIATNIDQAVEDLVNCKEQITDVGMINDKLFQSSISAGSIPETVWEVSKDQKEKFGSLAYFIEGFKSLREEENYSIEMTIDGKEMKVDLTLLVIGLSNSVAGIPNFFNEATYDDGYLYLFGLKKSTLGEKISVMTSLLNDSEALSDEQNKGFVIPFKQGSFKNDHNLNVALDGEKGPCFPFDIKILPAFLTFLVPEN